MAKRQQRKAGQSARRKDTQAKQTRATIAGIRQKNQQGIPFYGYSPMFTALARAAAEYS